MSSELMSGIIAGIVSLVGIIVTIIVSRMSVRSAFQNELVKSGLQKQIEMEARLRGYIVEVEGVRIALWSIIHYCNIGQDHIDNEIELDHAWVETFKKTAIPLTDKQLQMREAWASIKMDAVPHPATAEYREFQHKCLGAIIQLVALVDGLSKNNITDKLPQVKSLASQQLKSLDRLQSKCLSAYVITNIY